MCVMVSQSAMPLFRDRCCCRCVQQRVAFARFNRWSASPAKVMMISKQQHSRADIKTAMISLVSLCLSRTHRIITIISSGHDDIKQREVVVAAAVLRVSCIYRYFYTLTPTHDIYTTAHSTMPSNRLENHFGVAMQMSFNWLMG